MSTTAQIRSFLARFTPRVARDARAARARLRRLVPRGYELVYDNYNALAFGFSPSPRPSEALVSIVVYPGWLRLFFLSGAQLADPDGLLEGTGRRVRSILLDAPSTLDRRGVRKLIERALSPHREAFAAAPKLRTRVQSISPVRRPRRPASARKVARSR
jgi:hypothetical protein